MRFDAILTPPGIRLEHGDCRVIMAQLAEAGVRVDSIATDPPYHFASIVERFGKTDAAPARSRTFDQVSRRFIGQEWDGGEVAFEPATWRAAFELIKPGGYLAAFAASSNYHRMASAIEAAGFTVRDCLMWLYGTGMPKSHKVGDDMRTALKPAVEPICLAQRPIAARTIHGNIQAHGTGGLRIEACHVGERYPANVAHDGSAEVVQLLGDAARFYYCAKAGPLDRLGSDHPTVKPVELMRWLLRLITPQGGTTLDPFAGTGSTGVAAHTENLQSILIEREIRFIQDCQARLRWLGGRGAHTAQARHREVETGKAQGADLPLFTGSPAP